MQSNHSKIDKAPDPSRTTLFVVDKVGKASDGNVYATGAAYNYDKEKYEYMAVRLANKKEYQQFYKSIYPEQSDIFAKNQAESEARLTKENVSLRDNSIRGVIGTTIELGERYARKFEEELTISNPLNPTKAMLEDINGRLVVAFDNLSVSNEEVFPDGQKIQIATATRVQATNPYPDTKINSVAVRQGYVMYKPAQENGKEKATLVTYDANALLKFSHLNSEKGKSTYNDVLERAFDNTMSDYELPTAERRGRLEVHFFFENSGGQKDSIMLTYEPEIDYQKKNEDASSYIPRVDHDTTVRMLKNGDDHATRKLRQDLVGGNVDPTKLAISDAMRLIVTAGEDYNKAVSGDYLKVGNYEGSNLSPAQNQLKELMDAIKRDPDSVIIAPAAVTYSQLGGLAERNILSSKNHEYTRIRNGDATAKENRVVNARASEISSLSSMVRSQFVDANGEPIINNIISPMIVSYVQTGTSATAYPRGMYPYVPFPHVENGKYTPSSQSFFSDRALPHGAANKFNLTHEGTFANLPENNVLSTMDMKQQKALLESHLSLHEEITEAVLADPSNQMVAIPKVPQRQYFNAPVERKGLVKKPENPADRSISKAQIGRLAVILGNYKNRYKQDEMDKVFHTDYRRERMEALFNEIVEENPNYFMSRNNPEHLAKSYRHYGGVPVVRDILENPTPQKVNIREDYGDVVEMILNPNAPDSVLQRDYAPQPESKPATIKTATPSAANSLENRIKDVYEPYKVENQKSIDELLGLNKTQVEVPKEQEALTQKRPSPKLN